jgi:hypothetical protein
VIGGGGKGEFYNLVDQVVPAVQESASPSTNHDYSHYRHSHPPREGGDGDCNNDRQSPSNNSHDGNDCNASKSRNGENSVESYEDFERRVLNAYGSLDHPHAKAMIEAWEAKKAGAGKDVRAMLAAEQARLRAMKEKKDGEGS